MIARLPAARATGFLATFALALTVGALAHAAPPVRQKPADLRTIPGHLKPAGRVVSSFAWTDARGENLVLFALTTKTKPPRHADGEPSVTKRLVIRHYTNAALVREFKDAVVDCWADPSLEVLERASSVTDLDGDGVGEATFAYKLGCRSDVSPIGLKVLMSEAGDKYALRGETSVPVSATERMGGKYKVDSSFKTAPPGFLDHAVKQWKAVVREVMGG